MHFHVREVSCFLKSQQLKSQSWPEGLPWKGYLALTKNLSWIPYPFLLILTSCILQSFSFNEPAPNLSFSPKSVLLLFLLPPFIMCSSVWFPHWVPHSLVFLVFCVQLITWSYISKSSFPESETLSLLLTTASCWIEEGCLWTNSYHIYHITLVKLSFCISPQRQRIGIRT